MTAFLVRMKSVNPHKTDFTTSHLPLLPAAVRWEAVSGPHRYSYEKNARRCDCVSPCDLTLTAVMQESSGLFQTGPHRLREPAPAQVQSHPGINNILAIDIDGQQSAAGQKIINDS